MKTKNILIGIVMVFILISFISATNVCCEITKDKAFCQETSVDNCASGGKAQTSCSETTYCKTGTCIDTLNGDCYKSTKAACDNAKGTWDAKDEDEIEFCQTGCCVMNTWVAYQTYTGCKEMATKYGLSLTSFRTDLSQDECTSLSLEDELGACVYEEEYSKDCDNSIPRETCLENGGEFYPELLCTTEGLSDCAMSDKTTCYNDKVYFKDTCGNIANVYDSEKIKEPSYWEDVQDPSCIVTGASSICGACSYIGGTTCTAYEKGEPTMPKNNPDKVDYVCASMGCYHHGEYYQHGESWCGETEGTSPHLPLYLIYSASNTALSDNEKKEVAKARENLRDDSVYNLPGSRYTRLYCWEGEVFVEDCADYRQEVCVESEIVEDYLYSQCIINGWRNCMAIETKIDCEDTSALCKWVTGYRYDAENVNPKAYGSAEYNFEEQGSCVPLIPTGLNFWNAEDETYGEEYCNLGGSVTEEVQYETSWTAIGKDRDTLLKDENYEETKFRANQCYDNCYAIPDYAEEFSSTGEYDLKDLIKFHSGGNIVSEIPDNLKISNRRGYYCKKATGPVDAPGWGIDYNFDCKLIGNEKDARNKIPVYYTNEQWLNSLRERTVALGDCGYKENFMEVQGDILQETITAEFQKLKQSGKVKDKGDLLMIWAGGDWIKEKYDKFKKSYDAIVRDGEQPDISDIICIDEDGEKYYCE